MTTSHRMCAGELTWMFGIAATSSVETDATVSILRCTSCDYVAVDTDESDLRVYAHAPVIKEAAG